MVIASLGYGVLLLVIIALLTPSNEQSPATTPTKSEAPAPEQPQTQKQTFVWATADVTADNVKAALNRKPAASPVFHDSDFPKDITEVQIIDNAAKPGQKNVHVHFKSGTVWDETDLVKRIGGTFISACSTLYANPKVETVAMFALAEMTDQYGETETEVVIKLVCTREIANKVDWKGLAERHTTDPGNIYRIADHYYIHPGVLKNVKLNEVRLL